MFRYDATAGATEEQRYHTHEVEHLGNFKEATFFYHPQCVYNGSDYGDAIQHDKIDRMPRGTLNADQVRGYYTYNPKCELTYQVQLGSKVYPQMEVKTSQEAFYELVKTIGAHEMSSTYAVDILPREYRSWKHIMAVSFENAPGSAYSGLSTRAGDLLNIRIKNAHHVNNAPFPAVNSREILPYSTPEYIYCVLEHDAVLNISDMGVSLFD